MVRLIKKMQFALVGCLLSLSSLNALSNYPIIIIKKIKNNTNYNLVIVDRFSQQSCLLLSQQETVVNLKNANKNFWTPAGDSTLLRNIMSQMAQFNIKKSEDSLDYLEAYLNIDLLPYIIKDFTQEPIKILKFAFTGSKKNNQSRVATRPISANALKDKAGIIEVDLEILDSNLNSDIEKDNGLDVKLI